MDDLKDCFSCRHVRREQTGPHEWVWSCALQQREFPHAVDCGFLEPGPAPAADTAADWPYPRNRS